MVVEGVREGAAGEEVAEGVGEDSKYTEITVEQRKDVLQASWTAAQSRGCAALSIKARCGLANVQIRFLEAGASRMAGDVTLIERTRWNGCSQDQKR